MFQDPHIFSPVVPQISLTAPALCLASACHCSLSLCLFDGGPAHSAYWLVCIVTNISTNCGSNKEAKWMKSLGTCMPRDGSLVAIADELGVEGQMAVLTHSQSV